MEWFEADLETRKRRGTARCDRPALSPEPTVISGPLLLPRAKPGSVAFLQQGSVLMSVACITTKDHADLLGLGCHLRTC